MAIPSAIKAQIAALSAAFDAALPLAQAPRAAIRALQINAGSLVASVDAAIPGAAGSLDDFSAPVMPGDIATAMSGLLTSAQNQADLVNLRGVVGRAASNLNQA